MKNKNGFTLVEIIITIALLAAVACIFAVNMVKFSNKNKDEQEKEVEHQIFAAAEAFISTNPEEAEKLYKGYGYIDIPIGELRDTGLLSEDLKNTTTGEKIPDKAIVRVYVTENGLSPEFITDEEAKKPVTSYFLRSNELIIGYDKKTTKKKWCENNSNLYNGLYTKDSETTNTDKLGLYIENTLDKSIYGLNEIKYSDYFDEKLDLKVIGCTVNPQIAGEYSITYQFNDFKQKIKRTETRKVLVKSSMGDVVNFTAEINNPDPNVPSTKTIIKKTPMSEINVIINEEYKDGTTLNKVKSVDTLEEIGYIIENFKVDEATNSTVYAHVSRTLKNSDGTYPKTREADYRVVKNEVSVTFEAGEYACIDGSCNTTRTTKTLEYKEPYGTLPIATKEGYTFKGWYTENNGAGQKIDSSSIVTNYKQHTLYAYFTLTPVSLRVNKIALSQITNTIEANMNIIFVLDESGSMSGTRNSNLKTVTKNIVSKMNSKSTVSIIGFASSAHTYLKYSHDKSTINSKLNSIKASGGTRYGGALSLAKSIAEEKTGNNYDKYVIFVSDGHPGDSYNSSAISNLKSSVKGSYSIGVGTDNSYLRDIGYSGYYTYKDYNSNALDDLYRMFDNIVEKITIEEGSDPDNAISINVTSNLLDVGKILSSDRPINVYIGNSTTPISTFTSQNTYITRDGATYYFDLIKYARENKNVGISNINNLRISYYI